MKKLVFGLLAVVLFGYVGMSQPKENVVKEIVVDNFSCHEVNISILGVVTVNDFYVCCGEGFTTNTFPPRLCRKVSKRFFDLVQDNQLRQAQPEEVLNIRDLIPDYDKMEKMTSIIVEKSSVFEYDGKQCSVKLGKYIVGGKGEIDLEIEEKK